MLQKIQRAFFLSIILGAFSCSVSAGGATPTQERFATRVPDIRIGKTEIELPENYEQIDPRMVLGVIFDKQTKEPRSFDGYLKQGASVSEEELFTTVRQGNATTRRPLVIFDKYIEKNIAANASWLNFLSARMGDNAISHVSLTKTKKVIASSDDFDKQRLTTEIPDGERDRYGIIVGYFVYELSTEILEETDDRATADVAIAGANADAKYYKKSTEAENTHKVVALWAPLPFAVKRVENTAKPTADLAKATETAIRQNQLQVNPINEALKTSAPPATQPENPAPKQ